MTALSLFSSIRYTPNFFSTWLTAIIIVIIFSVSILI